MEKEALHPKEQSRGLRISGSGSSHISPDVAQISKKKNWNSPDRVYGTVLAKPDCVIASTEVWVPQVQVKRCGHGRGVFTQQRIDPGDKVLNFGGPIMHRDELPKPLLPHEDHYLQIDEDLFLGPSGRADDLVNHSCEPNTGIVFVNGELVLVAIAPIDAGGQLFFDYSTTMRRAPCELDCACGAAQCRGRIRDFFWLPKAVQARYLRLGIVLDHALCIPGRG